MTVVNFNFTCLYQFQFHSFHQFQFHLFLSSWLIVPTNQKNINTPLQWTMYFLKHPISFFLIWFNINGPSLRAHIVKLSGIDNPFLQVWAAYLKLRNYLEMTAQPFQATAHQCTIRLSPVGIWKLRMCWKIWPWLPLSKAKIILDEDIWMFSPFQFYFQFIFGYELKTACCSSKIAKESIAILADCWKDVNEIEGPSWT